MKIQFATARSVIQTVASRLTVQLAQEPTIINAPPSQKSAYPAIAIMIDKTIDDLGNDDQDLEFDPNKSPGDPGYILTGGFRTDPVTNDYVTGTTFRLDQDTTLSMIGVARLRGRIWCGARLAPQREQLQHEIKFVFYDDRAAPGRLLVPVEDVTINDVRITFGMATAMLGDETQWVSEYAFAERLWAYLPIDFDVPIIVPRRDPIVTRLLLQVSQDLQTPIVTPDDVDNLQFSSTFSIDESGDATLVS